MMPPASAKDMLMQVKRYADGGDVSSAGLAKAMSSGLTQTQYDDNIRAYIAKTANPLDALNAASENGVSMADINRALGKQVAADYFTTDYNTETAPSTNVATGFTSPIAQRYNAPGAQGQSALDAEIKRVSQQYAANTPENAQILRDMFIQEGGSIADLQRAGFDPSRLLGTVAKKPVVPPVTPAPPVTSPYTQTQPTYTAPTVYQPLPEPPPIYAAGQPALDVAFRNSPARTYDPVYGYTYSPAAKLLSATGSGMSFTPPSVTSRPRSLLNVPLPVRQTPNKKWSEFTPEEKASFGLSASQVFAREESEKQSTSPNRFAGQVAPIQPPDYTTNPNAIEPIEFRFFQKGGPVKKPEGTADNSDRAPVASPKTADQYADVFGEMDNIDKLSSLLKGGYLGAKYLLSSPNQYLEHGRYPDVIREKLQQEYWDLGTERVDAGPLDAALNYAGAYDWAVRPDVDPEDARKMAEAYQLRYYIDPNRVPQNEVADYHRNMAGIEAGVRDRALNKRLSDAELMAEAVAYAADQTGTSVPRTRSQTYADIVRETPPEAKSRDANPTNTPKGSYLPGLQDGGYVTRKQDGGTVSAPMSNAELLAQIDRSTANSPAPATGTASSAPDREVTESQNMLRRLSDAFGQNVTAPVVGSMLDMTTGLGDLAQMGLKAGAGKLGIETKPFTPVSSALQESLGVAGYDPYSPAALAASVLLPAAGPLRTAAAATRPMMSMAAAPGSAKQTLSLIKPILDREASVAASAELAAMGARELAPDNVTAEIAAAIAGGGAYNTLDNILSSASRGPITSGMAAKAPTETTPSATTPDIQKLISQVPSYHMEDWTQNAGLPEDVVAKYWKLGDAQRDVPERAMVQAQKVLGGGVLSPTIEHIGDLTNRMTPKHSLGFAYEETLAKAKRYLASLKSGYGFRREYDQNMRSNAAYNNVPYEEHKANVDAALLNYANAHRALAVHNPLQRLARDASVALGEQRFEDAGNLLDEFVTRIPTKKAFVEEMKKFETAPKAADDLAALTAKAVKPRVKTPKTGTSVLPPTESAANLAKFLEGSVAPPVVYHSTKSDFDKFSPTKLGHNTQHPTSKFGVFTATDPKSTEEFISPQRGSSKGKYESGANIMPLHLSIKNPIEISSSDFMLQAMGLGNMKKKTADKLVKDFVNEAKAKGYDGLVIRSSPNSLTKGAEFSSDNWVAFDPSQIKSAIGNVGTFDPTNPVITKAQGGYVTKKTKGAKP